MKIKKIIHQVIILLLAQSVFASEAILTDFEMSRIIGKGGCGPCNPAAVNCPGGTAALCDLTGELQSCWAVDCYGEIAPTVQNGKCMDSNNNPCSEKYAQWLVAGCVQTCIRAGTRCGCTTFQGLSGFTVTLDDCK